MAITTELPKSIYERLKPFLRTRGYACEVSDCTPPGMNTTLLHLEFSSDLSSQDCRIINAEIDRIQEELSREAHQQPLYHTMQSETEHSFSERSEELSFS